jgi:hypothetical protein
MKRHNFSPKKIIAKSGHPTFIDALRNPGSPGAILLVMRNHTGESAASVTSWEGFLAPVLGVRRGREAIHASTSSRFHPRVLAPSAIGFGKPYRSMERASCMRSLMIPFSLKYRNLTNVGFFVVSSEEITLSVIGHILLDRPYRERKKADAC